MYSPPTESSPNYSNGSSVTLSEHDSTAASKSYPVSETSEENDTAQAISSDGVTLDQNCEEQALESHEVIELQLFSERKTWIEEKIRFLENMPPVEVFVGLDAIRSSAEEVPALPTRPQLTQWLVEHDQIERETDVFDSGELQKLRKLTKAATQRNLSPEDTDLIELTLTTIYELDKLLHLLRDRSENLDLLGIRLTWEEHRIGSWVDRRNIISDLDSFLENRARWSPSVYDCLKAEETPKRRSSIGSITSMTSETSAAVANSAQYSRSARFKLAELLSRDAANFGSRVTSLRHGKISVAGKALDKLIDNSRKPVPEELLDEQDRLEEKGINDLENVGKFVMNVVTQWRKADEIYIETMKDNNAAQNLLEEIETAQEQHPTSRQSALFVSRADVLIKRLYSRGDPASSYSTFPRPIHPLFPNQQTSNETLTQSLSSKIATTMELAKKADIMAKEYRTKYEAVKHAEILSKTANSLSTQYETIIHRFEKGMIVNDGDGSPPDLSATTCLEATRHSAFLALFPSTIQELNKTNQSADEILRCSTAALLNLSSAGIDSSFRTSAISEFQRLTSLQAKTKELSDDITARISRLRDTRRIWSLIADRVKELGEVSQQVGDAMEKQSWKRQSGVGGRPPTPESPVVAVHSADAFPTQSMERLDNMVSQISHEIDLPLTSLSRSLGTPLLGWLSSRAFGLKGLLESVRQMAKLLDAIDAQATAMATIRAQFDDFQIRTEDLRLQFDVFTQDVLAGKLVGAALTKANTELNLSSQELRNAVQTFIEGLTNRVLFVAQQDESRSQCRLIKRKLSSGDLEQASKQSVTIELPFQLSSLDEGVRADSNSYVMRLSGELRNLDQKRKFFNLSQIAKDLDAALSLTVDRINSVMQEIVAYKRSLSSAMEQDNVTAALQSLGKEFEDFSQANRTEIARSFSPIRELLRQMDSASDSDEKAISEALFHARDRAVDDAELKFNVWNDEVAAFKCRLVEAQNLSRMGHDVDTTLGNTLKTLNDAAKEVHSFKLLFSSIKEQGSETSRLQTLLKDFEAFSQTNHSSITRSFSNIRELIRQMDTSHSTYSAAAYQAVVLARSRTANHAELSFKTWGEDTASFTTQILEAQHLSQLANDVDVALSSSLADSDHVVNRLASFKLSLSSILEQSGGAEELRSLWNDFEVFSNDHLSISESLTPIRDVLRQMDALLGYDDNVSRETMYLARTRAVDNAELKANTWKEAMKLFEDRLSEARRAESQRLEEQRVAEGRQKQLQKERLETEYVRKVYERSEAEKLKAEELCQRGALAENDAKSMRLEHQRLTSDKNHILGPRTTQDSEVMAPDTTEKTILEIDSLVGEETPSAGQNIEAASAPQPTIHSVLYRKTPDNLDEDVFGLCLAPSNSREAMTQEMNDLQFRIRSLRKRLHSISINSVARPSHSSASSNRLPSQEQRKRMDAEFLTVSQEASLLPSSADHSSVNLELRSLKSELEASAVLLGHIGRLADLSDTIRVCDNSLSDLLEHVDSYPAPPTSALSSPHVTQTHLPPEEQLSARLAFTKSVVDSMTNQLSSVSDDARALNETNGVIQTWSELEDMAYDRMSGRKSRPPSAISSGRSSRVSHASSHSSGTRKSRGYANLSVGLISREHLLAPSHSTARRTVSGASDARSRSTSRTAGHNSNRSVSGPFISSSNLYTSTFASRQRTTSLSADIPQVTAPSRRPSGTPSRPRADAGNSKASNSPTFSSTSSLSRSVLSPSRSSNTSASTWARAPRESFRTGKATPPRKLQSKKTYVANPKNKLDVAVGDVVNKLPVNINIEVVAETWKDQSGKYWIGDQDPKLCFCRILRSQTVMVRVGGGWTELSKFIKDHYADLFRVLPDSPPRHGVTEEKWISSATLLEAPEDENVETCPSPPRTPEPKGAFFPSFSLSTPSGQSPRSLKSSPPSGSSLAGLQFMRRTSADPSIMGPVTPTKSPGRRRHQKAAPNTPALLPPFDPHRLHTASPLTPAKTAAWRP